jgi:hypothetical protein
LSPLTAALALAVAAGTFEHRPAEGGRPEVVLIPTDAPTVGLLISFGGGSGDDLGLPGLSAQAQSAMLYANRSFDPEAFSAAAFAGAARLDTSLGRYRTNFVLTAPAREFVALAKPLLRGLLRPQLDRAAHRGLKDRAHLTGVTADQTEELVSLLEPLLVPSRASDTADGAEWRTFAQVKQFADDMLTPANARVVIVGGFDVKAVDALLTGLSGGKPRTIARARTALDLRAELPLKRNVYVVGYPLPELDQTKAAAVRVFRRYVQGELMAQLREKGLAYSVDASITLSPWFNGLLVLLPAADSSGTDVQPFVFKSIYELVHRPIEPEVLGALRAGELAANERAKSHPADFVWEVASGRADADWLSPENGAALEHLSAEDFTQAMRDFFVNERERFSVTFTRSLLCPEFSGVYKRQDGMSFRVTSVGCRLVGESEGSDIRHLLFATFEPRSLKGSVSVRRFDPRIRCSTAMKGTVEILLPDTITFAITGTDGECGILKSYTDKSTYLREH